ncbi:hypothetical protein [Paenibacillus sp. GP183]|uniref:hypothetical protein n=1 Tax=Paenibacillus sp. GP183 TaxID=1882751 RepID=UPI00209AB72A|nr:hypothetical protein [Paenibacillus sp. GP183]
MYNANRTELNNNTVKLVSTPNKKMHVRKTDDSIDIPLPSGGSAIGKKLSIKTVPTNAYKMTHSEGEGIVKFINKRKHRKPRTISPATNI